MKRTVLEFSLRNREGGDFEEVRAAVEAALSCRFVEGRFRGVDASVSDVLGMVVAIYPWRGAEDRPVIRLHTDVEDERFYLAPDGTITELDGQDISAAIADLLEVRGAGRWHVPSAEDIQAESAHHAVHEQRFRAAPDDIARWESE